MAMTPQPMRARPGSSPMMRNRAITPSAESPLLSVRNGATGRNRNPDQNASVMFPQHQQEFEFRVASRKRNSEFISDYQRFATKARSAAIGQGFTNRFAGNSGPNR